MHIPIGSEKLVSLLARLSYVFMLALTIKSILLMISYSVHSAHQTVGKKFHLIAFPDKKRFFFLILNK